MPWPSSSSHPSVALFSDPSSAALLKLFPLDAGNIWIQLIFGGALQTAHFILVPETRATIMMDNIAKERSKNDVNTDIRELK
jgi:hypothetical protein